MKREKSKVEKIKGETVEEEGNAPEIDVKDAKEMKDIKLGEIELREGSVLLIKKTNYKGDDRIDFRVWMNSPTYKGPTKQGFVVPMDKIDEFVAIVSGMKEKL